MKLLKRLLLVVLVALAIVVYYNYPKLNILAGYAAKNAASSVYLADRTLAFIDSTDNNFSPINLSQNTLDLAKKSATGSAFGLLKRTAVYREGLGAVLVTEDFDPTEKYLVPNRTRPELTKPYPYGHGVQKDTVFANIDYERVHKAIDKIFESENKTRSVLIIYKDQIIAERYGANMSKDSKVLGWSMTKSITGTLFGILQHKGVLNVQQKAPIKEWQNDERKNITIHNLLQMNSGLEWVEDYNSISDVTKMLFLQRDMTKTQINKPLVGKPNESWLYSSGTTNLLSGIIRSQFKTHQEYLDFWYKELIDKIGMYSMDVEADMEGNYVGSSYAWATTRDWAKFGLLYLHNGNWDGVQLFDKDWVTYATTPTPSSKNEYGAQIWLNRGGRLADAPKTMYSFRGYQGQRVFMLPEQEMVIVRTGLNEKVDTNSLIKEIISSIKN